MDAREFENAVDTIFMEIEDKLDELESDVDVDSSGGVLTLTMEDDSQIIFSRQSANQEIWIAARSGGFHLQHNGQEWQCGSTGEDFSTLVNRLFTEQASTAIF